MHKEPHKYTMCVVSIHHAKEEKVLPRALVLGINIVRRDALEKNKNLCLAMVCVIHYAPYSGVRSAL